MMCQVEGCNNKGTMVTGIMLTDKMHGSVTLDIFLCEEHNDDPRFLATEWASSLMPVSDMMIDDIDVERELLVKEARKHRITSSSASNRTLNHQRNVSSSSKPKRIKLKRNLQLP